MWEVSEVEEASLNLWMVMKSGERVLNGGGLFEAGNGLSES